jgi:hypothetical protein
MTIFGVDKSKGDVVAVVTVNDGEASKVRFLDSDIAASGGIIERGVNPYSIRFDSNTQITKDSVAQQETTEEGLNENDEENDG